MPPEITSGESPAERTWFACAPCARSCCQGPAESAVAAAERARNLRRVQAENVVIEKGYMSCRDGFGYTGKASKYLKAH
jgi:hypothetical protein